MRQGGREDERYAAAHKILVGSEHDDTHGLGSRYALSTLWLANALPRCIGGSAQVRVAPAQLDS